MTGHFASVCKTSRRKQEQKNYTQKSGGESRVNCVGEDGGAEEYAFTVRLTKSCEENGSENIDFQVGGVVVEGVLIDSGSSCKILDRRMWEELKQKGIKCN